MSFIARSLSFTFQKATGTFANGSNVVMIPPGLQASLRMLNAAVYSMPHAQTTIWGLPQSIMNELSTLGMIVNLQPANFINIFATDESGAPSLVFKGAIKEALPDYNRQPEAPIWVDAYSGLDIAVAGAQPSGGTLVSDAVVLLKQLCDAAGYNFEPGVVSGVSLGNQYLYGSPRDQILTILQAIQYRQITGAFVENNTVALWPTKSARGGQVPLVDAGTPASPGTLIGYPSYTNSGISFRCLYNPLIRLGAQVQVKTSLPLQSPNVPVSNVPSSAQGLWNVYGLAHFLDSQMAGKWETQVEATRAGYPTPVIATTTAG